MSEERRPIDRDKVTWRAIVLSCLAVIGFLCARVLNQIDKTADIAVSVQTGLIVLGTRVDSAEREIVRLRDGFYRSRPNPERATP